MPKDKRVLTYGSPSVSILPNSCRQCGVKFTTHTMILSKASNAPSRNAKRYCIPCAMRLHIITSTLR